MFFSLVISAAVFCPELSAYANLSNVSNFHAFSQLFILPWWCGCVFGASVSFVL